MKRKTVIYIIYAPLVYLFISCNNPALPSKNLLINGSAELEPYDSTPKGWVNNLGHWRSVEGDSITHGYAYAQSGRYHFFEGQDSSGILQQDVNIARYSGSIDRGIQQFVFSGYLRSYLQTPADQGSIIIMALNDPGDKALYTFNSDTVSSVNNWQQVTDTFTVPRSSRRIRIQLVAHRRNGSDNDAYFDNLQLIALPAAAGNHLKFIVLIAIACVLAAGFIVLKRKQKRPR